MKQLNFGCGKDIKEGWDNFDAKNFDFNKFPYPIEDDTYDYIYCKDVLEHLDHPLEVIKELIRITKDQATLEIIIPHYTNKGAYNHIQHIHYYDEEAFKNLEKENENLKLMELKVLPTWAGKILISSWLRKKLSLFINGLNKKIIAKFQIQKIERRQTQK